MGSSQSKSSPETDRDSNLENGKRSKSAPLDKEKHNSADSHAPLAQHAAKLNFPTSPSDDRRMSFPHSDNVSATVPQAITIAQTRPSSVVTLLVSPPHCAYSAANDSIAEVNEFGGHRDISRPPPPPRLRRLSELIDPEEIDFDSHVQSPNGNLLAPEQFLVHPERPRSIRERQERIREKVRAASQLCTEVNISAQPAPLRDLEVEGGTGSNEEKKRKRGCFGWFRGS